MPRNENHVSDQELLLAADGELSPRRAALVRAHLEACWECRARGMEIEAAIIDFARAHRQSLDPQLPSAAGPRALLCARLAQLTASHPSQSGWRFPRGAAVMRIGAVCAALMVAAWVGTFAVRLLIRHTRGASGNASEQRIIPDRSLTPGATRMVSFSEVCSMSHEEVVKAVPNSLRQRVFAEYGIENARAGDYEIDYLIAPGLGGADDIHNLWPEPYRPDAWNAYAKDALEERLHQMVCAHAIDLPTAQREIATDWIAAYKKYFHTDRPIFIHAQLGSVGSLAKPRQFFRELNAASSAQKL
jgi:hypothetical protein